MKGSRVSVGVGAVVAVAVGLGVMVGSSVGVAVGGTVAVGARVGSGVGLNGVSPLQATRANRAIRAHIASGNLYFFIIP